MRRDLERHVVGLGCASCRSTSCANRSRTAGDRCARAWRPRPGRSASSSAFASIRTDLRSGCGCDAIGATDSRLSENPAATARASGVPARGRVLDVLRDQLNRLPVLVEHDDLRQADRIRHRAAENAALADAVVDRGLEEERSIEVLGIELDPDFLILLPEIEETLRFLRVLGDVGERLRELRGLRGGGRRCGDGRGAATKQRAGRRAPHRAAIHRFLPAGRWPRHGRQRRRSRRCRSIWRRRQAGRSRNRP